MANINPISVQNVIDIGNICTFLSSDEIAIKSQFGNPYPIHNIPLLIMEQTERLSFAYTSNSYDPSVNSLADYLLSLCGKWIPSAERILGDKQGVVVGTGGDNLNQLVIPRDFPQIIVGKAGALIQDGDTEFTLMDVEAAPNNRIAAWCFIERELTDDADPAIVDQMTIQPQWIPNTGYKFTLANGATFKTGQVVRGQYPVTQNLTYTTAASGNQILSYYATLNGAETKSLLNTQGQIYLLPVNTFQTGSVTIFAKSDTNERFSMIWRGTIYNEGGDITVAASGDSFVFSNPFGDDFFNNIVIGADDSFQGIRITMTGIDGKIINCEAKFNFTTATI